MPFHVKDPASSCNASCTLKYLKNLIFVSGGGVGTYPVKHLGSDKHNTINVKHLKIEHARIQVYICLKKLPRIARLGSLIIRF